MSRDLNASDFAKGIGDNRRSEPRVPCSRLIEILPCRASKQWKFLSGELIDCSLSGVGMLLAEPMEVGQQFLVKLRLSGQMKLLLYTVHDCALWERTRYRIGARFSGFAASEVEPNSSQSILKALVEGG